MFYDWLIGPFVESAPLRHALVAALAVSLGAAPVGVFLNLRRMSLMGDAMAHAILPGVAVGFLVAGLSLPAMTLGGLIAGLAVTLIAGLIARLTTIKEDASLAAFYLLSLASGVVLISLKGGDEEILHVLFGDILGLSDEGLFLLGGIASVTLLVFALIFRPLVAECVDPGFLAAQGGRGWLAHFAFLGASVLTLVGGFQALGTLLAVGIVILPATAARLWTRQVGSMIALALGFAFAASYLGLLVAHHGDLPTSPTIVLLAGAFYLISLLTGRHGGLYRRFFPARHLEA